MIDSYNSEEEIIFAYGSINKQYKVGLSNTPKTELETAYNLDLNVSNLITAMGLYWDPTVPWEAMKK